MLLLEEMNQTRRCCMNELEAGKNPLPTKTSDFADDDYLVHDFILLIDLS